MSDGKGNGDEHRMQGTATAHAKPAGAPPSAKVESAPDVDFDFSQDDTKENRVAAPHVGQKYDPRPHEDGARRTIAYLLIGLLWLVIAAMFELIAFGSIGVAEIKDFAVVLGPVVTLVSAATGFYYGTKSTAPR